MKQIIREFKKRYYAKPYDIYKEEVCEKEKNNGYWLVHDGSIYLGIDFLFSLNQIKKGSGIVKDSK